MDSLNFWRNFRLSLCCLVLISGSNLLHSQAQIRGVSSSGGQNSIGKVFSFIEDGTQFGTEADFFNSTEGEMPESPLLEASDGWLYGTTSSGGENGGGTLYRINENSEFQVLHHFTPSTDGTDPKSNLIESEFGNFIGTCSTGGQNGAGTIFNYSASQGYIVLHHFASSTQGANPSGQIFYSSEEDMIYGACSNGGSGNSGSLYRYSLSGNFNLLHSFDGTLNGGSPQSGLTLANDGLMYGCFRFGGEFNHGGVFSFNPSNNDYAVVYNLNNGSFDGRSPVGALIESSSGVFLGTCSQGGQSGVGTIFKVTSTGEFTRLISLVSPTTGSSPKAGLLFGEDDFAYGLNEFGGSQGYGTLFRINEGGSFTKLLDLDYNLTGANPLGTPIFTNLGSLAFVCSDGGSNDFGTLTTYTETGVQKVHDFSLPLEGSFPNGIQALDDHFVGTSLSGGATNNGVIFRLNLDGSLIKLHDFNGEDGQNPNPNLHNAGDGFLYGSCRFGGQSGTGTIYRVNDQGDFELLHEFVDNSNGQFPGFSPIKHSNGSIYGTASSGGDFGDGILFEIDDQGVFSVVKNFNGFFDGESPGALVEYDNGLIIGLCEEGGNTNDGVIFSFDPEEDLFEVLHSFSQGTDGEEPRSILTIDTSTNSIYGTTSDRGPNSGGTLFSYNPEDGFNVLHSFASASDGATCISGVVTDNEGSLYGFCSEGGSLNSGTSFKYDESGYQVLYNFSFLDAPGLSGAPALFFPDCFSDSDCIAEDACSVGRCNFGLCEEVPINPAFSNLQIGNCEVGLDVFSMTIMLTMDISPGGMINISGQDFTLTDGITSYQFQLENLPSNGEEIDLLYSFSETGCTGTTGILGTAPVPCPPIEISFTVDVGDLEVGPEGIFIGGSFQDWSPSEIPMTDMGDGMWQATAEIGSGSYEFNFFNGSSIFDGEYVIGECASNGKRQITVGEESESLNFCWEICGENCSLGIASFGNPGVVRLRMYPNPLNRGQYLSVELPDGFNAIDFQIIGMTGAVIEQGPVNNDLFRIHTNGFRPGVYTLIVREARTGNIGTGKFVVN